MLVSIVEPRAEESTSAVFDKFGPESGLAYFEMFFWMLDKTQAAAVYTNAVHCSVLSLSSTDDNLVSPLETARGDAAPYRGATS